MNVILIDPWSICIDSMLHWFLRMTYVRNQARLLGFSINTAIQFIFTFSIKLLMLIFLVILSIFLSYDQSRPVLNA